MQEDLSPSFLKLGIQPNGYIIHNVSGIRTQIVQRLDGQGYDIKKCKLFHWALAYSLPYTHHQWVIILFGQANWFTSTIRQFSPPEEILTLPRMKFTDVNRKSLSDYSPYRRIPRPHYRPVFSAKETSTFQCPRIQQNLEQICLRMSFSTLRAKFHRYEPPKVRLSIGILKTPMGATHMSDRILIAC